MKPSEVVEHIEDAILALNAKLDLPDYESFMSVFEGGGDAVDAVTRDRVFVVFITSGPFRGAVSDCWRRFEITLGVRYYDRKESRNTAWNDSEHIVAALEGLRVQGLRVSLKEATPQFDYNSSIQGAIYISLDLQAEYSSDVR